MTDNCTMFIEEDHYFDEEDDALIRGLYDLNEESITTTTEKVADFYDITSDGKPPAELREYVTKLVEA